MNATADATFGPQLQGHFDFTLLFEQSIFSIGPSAILLTASLFRINVLTRRKPSFEASTLLWIKLIAVFILFGLQLTNLALWSISSTALTQFAVAAASLSVADVIVIGSLLYAEHRYSYSPSLLLSVYLSITILLDIAYVRSLFLRGSLDAIGAVTTAILATKLLVLMLEEIPKRGPAIFKTSKEFSSGLWNRSAFWWLNSTFSKGYYSFLQVDDLYSLDHHLDSHRLASKLDQTWKCVDKARKYCLAFATFTAFQSDFWKAVIPRLCYTGFSFAQPFLINKIVDVVGTSKSNHPQGTVGGLVGATALVYLGLAFSRCHYTHHTYRLITSVRGGLVTLIFTKVMDLEASEAKDSAAVTLMSTDVDGVASGLQKIHDIWASVIELGLGVYLLQRQVGAACFLVLVPTILSSLATARVARGMGPARVLWNRKVQERVSTTSSILDQIKGIKMMGLEDRIFHLIQSLRVSEVDSSKTFRLFIVWMNMIANLSDQLTPILIIAATVFWSQGGQNISVAEAFTTLSIVALVSSPMVNIIAAYPTLIGGLACLGRIQDFMLRTKRNDYRLVASSPQDSNSKCEMKDDDIELQGIQMTDFLHDRAAEASPAIRIENASFSLQGGNEAVLENINLVVRKSSLTMIVGPVGSGKSALLKAILGEAQILSGSVRLDCGRIAYCDQTAWLRLGSIRDNVLGPNDLDEVWYQQVLWACALNEDVAHLKDGDQSLVGSGGIALSGGQKQRVALARAVYSRAPVVLLDDVFSALDHRTSLNIFSRLLGGEGILRKRTTVLLVTHTVEYLPFADDIIVQDKTGSTVNRAPYSELRLNEVYPEIQVLGSVKENHQLPLSEFSEAKPIKDKPQGKDSAPHASAHEVTRKTGDLKLYTFYLHSVGPLLFIFWLVFAAGYIFSGKVPQIWLRIWTENGTASHAAAYFGGYLGFGLICVLFSGLCVYYFMIIIIPKSTQHIHALLLDAVLRAPLWLFTTTDTSTILNRFSQDMTLVDQVLPMAAFTTTFDVYNVIAGAALIASGATYVAAIIPFCILGIYMIQKFYLRTSRQMRHLDLEAKSPLYRLFTETASGIITVRALGWKEDLMNEHLHNLDHSQKPYYMLYCIQRWLNVVLDIFVASIAIILVGFALGFSNATSQGSIGLAMLNVMEFNQSLSMLINSWTGLETSLGAIARVKDFLAEAKAEGSEMEDETPTNEWPKRGYIQMTGVTAKYNVGDVQSQPAIRDVNLELQPGQQVLITGRTGSGKSSLILTLLHLLDLESGRITIDGMDLSRIPRPALRSRIVTIPQDPVELPGSVRYNLTQFSSLEARSGDNGEAMKRTLERVGLWETVSKRGGLDGELNNVGLSGGQKQLFSLARALLAVQNIRAEGGIVLLDEPTSSVDGGTEVDIQRIVREEFARHTIILVSHRLDAARDADIVVLMEGGKVAEVRRKGE
ncbi:hypothetical protein N7537_008861 [Penicillium hordei]|uniref:Uncharacterized protein n=1 Tax=Penicillium hordei TaxID=40994 RepID=A0AAD6E195_9EURO|nr:uncharacterized protein N7537_008861 [Penicillium hordei]KAJ5598777.1 hypothetical protein N7537_008861 [Penicillium hordei]